MPRTSAENKAASRTSRRESPVKPKPKPKRAGLPKRVEFRKGEPFAHHEYSYLVGIWCDHNYLTPELLSEVAGELGRYAARLPSKSRPRCSVLLAHLL